MSRFQAASESLERSYGELQKKVACLSQELQKEREERVRLERLAAMGEMAMELAHEIRNPLGSIELYASMLEGEDAHQIVRSVRLLNHTVTNILHFGKPIQPAFVITAVSELFEEIRGFLQPMASRNHIQIETVCEAGSTIMADRELMHRMLLNLVLNALRETPKEGTIRLEAHLAGSEVLLSVRDDGCGIPKVTLSRIFDPAFSTHREGCGLGLSIVKRIVESHDGTIDVSSSPKGTAFNIRLKRNMEVVSEPITCS